MFSSDVVQVIDKHPPPGGTRKVIANLKKNHIEIRSFLILVASSLKCLCTEKEKWIKSLVKLQTIKMEQFFKTIVALHVR